MSDDGGSDVWGESSGDESCGDNSMCPDTHDYAKDIEPLLKRAYKIQKDSSGGSFIDPAGYSAEVRPNIPSQVLKLSKSAMSRFKAVLKAGKDEGKFETLMSINDQLRTLILSDDEKR